MTDNYNINYINYAGLKRAFKLRVDLSQVKWPNTQVNFKVIYPQFKQFYLSLKDEKSFTVLNHICIH